MPARFVLQGLTPQNHIAAIAEVIQIEEIERALLSVAFVTAAGVGLLADLLRPNAAKTTIFAGVRNGITSAQGIHALVKLGIDIHIVDTGSAYLLFHPKLYYARGKNLARLLVGSANLTPGGLNNNIEASIVLNLDLASRPERKLALSIEDIFDQLPAKYPSNISKLATDTSIATLFSDPRLLDERSAPPMAFSKLAGGAGALRPVPLMKLQNQQITPRPSRQRRLQSAPAEGVPPGAVAPVQLAASYELLWIADDLTERDVNAPVGENTHATGSMNLDKGGMEDGFEFQTYFRDQVFDHLDWAPPDTRQIERAQAHFHLIVEGVDCGDFVLTVRHDTKTGTRSHQQGNAMTKLSWGAAKRYVAKAALIGRTMRLSRAIDDPTRFLIEIG